METDQGPGDWQGKFLRSSGKGHLEIVEHTQKPAVGAQGANNAASG